MRAIVLIFTRNEGPIKPATVARPVSLSWPPSATTNALPVVHGMRCDSISALETTFWRETVCCQCLWLPCSYRHCVESTMFRRLCLVGQRWCKPRSWINWRQQRHDGDRRKEKRRQHGCSENTWSVFLMKLRLKSSADFISTPKHRHCTAV